MMDHFESGDVSFHKDSQKLWVQDKNPVIESNTGWVETYLDPQEVRGYFQGWVAIQNKDISDKNSILMEDAEANILELLPFEFEMHNDGYEKPDFTQLDLICFASNGGWGGQILPNYEDI